MFVSKEAVASILLLFLTNHADGSHLRVKDETGLNVPDTSCMKHTAETDCTSAEDHAGGPCSWCKSTLMENIHMCLSHSEANMLPKDMFGCTTATEEVVPSAEEGEVQSSVDLSCVSHMDKESCLDSCSWCTCEEFFKIKACLPQDGAAALPKNYCSCESRQSDVSKDDVLTSHSFSFLDGVKHTLSDGPVDKNFCDPSSPRSLSGYMDVTGSKYDKEGDDKHLFFWMFEKRPSHDKQERDPKDIPMVVWLTGGPGCSSTLALLTENGPCSVNENGDGTVVNPNSWNEAAHVLWLDQPAGVGYSYGDESDKNEEMVGEDAYYFFQSFFQAHPEYLENPLFVVGESYGGHYAPAITHRIHQGNEDAKEGTVHINLRGLAVGNGLTNPAIQYQYYPEMAYHNSHNIQTVPEAAYKEMKNSASTCTGLIDKCNAAKNKFTLNFFCQSAMVLCSETLVTPYAMTGLNVYDIRKKCEKPPLCYDFSNVDKFLNSDSTREALHITKDSHRWYACNMAVHSHFNNDFLIDFSPYVADLLDADIPVLIYAGDVDFICNYLGNRAWTLELEWGHKAEFNDAKEHDWKDGKGLARSSNGFTFLQVYDAGHMVPTDQPEVALEMIRGFMAGEEF